MIAVEERAAADIDAEPEEMQITLFGFLAIWASFLILFGGLALLCWSVGLVGA